MPLPLPEQQRNAMFKPDSNQDVPGGTLFRGTSWLESVVDGVHLPTTLMGVIEWAV
jgi:hypothetical protein